MVSNTKMKVVALCLTCGFGTNVLASDWYFSGHVGHSSQLEDVTPYGNNIAVDSDFPSAFDSGSGNTFALGVGYYLDKNIRLEGRISYRDADFNETKFGVGSRDGEEYSVVGDLKSTLYSIDVFYDFPLDSALTPYIKAGIGLAHNEFSAKLGGEGVAAFDAFDGVVDGFYDLYADQSADNFSVNLGLGVSYALGDNIEGFAEYQYITLGDVATGQDSFTDGFMIDGAVSSEFSLGLRVAF